MNLEPIPPEMLAECRRLVRVHYGTIREPDSMLMASVFARGMQHARNLDKDEREAYEAERVEWEAERAEEKPIVVDLNFKMPDGLFEEIKARFLAAARSGRVEVLPDPPVFTPIEEIKAAARKEERDAISDFIKNEINAIGPVFKEANYALGAIVDWLAKRDMHPEG